jgi:hypothetical protein
MPVNALQLAWVPIRKMPKRADFVKDQGGQLSVTVYSIRWGLSMGSLGIIVTRRFAFAPQLEKSDDILKIGGFLAAFSSRRLLHGQEASDN